MIKSKVYFLPLLLIAHFGFGQSCSNTLYGLTSTLNGNNFSTFNYSEINITNGQVSQLSTIDYNSVNLGMTGIINDEYYLVSGQEIVFIDIDSGVENRRIPKNGIAIYLVSPGCGNTLYGFTSANDYAKIDIYSGQLTVLMASQDTGYSSYTKGIINNEFYYLGSNDSMGDALVFLDLETGVENRRFTSFANYRIYQSTGSGNLLYGMKTTCFCPNGFEETFFQFDIYTGQETNPAPMIYGNYNIANAGIINNELYIELFNDGGNPADNELVFLDIITGIETNRIALDNFYYQSFYPDCSSSCNTCVDGQINGFETGIDCGGPSCPACPCTEINLDYIGPDIIQDGTNKWVSQEIHIQGNSGPVQVISNSSVKLRAGLSIEVDPLFEVVQGAELLLTIENCL